MKHSRGIVVLAILLALNVLLALSLSPLGFESRPPANLTALGFVAIGAVFAGIVLDVAALVLLRRRTRLAAGLAIAGSIVFIFPNVVDRAGSFFSAPIPPVIDALEYAFIAVLLVTLAVAAAVYRAADRPGDAAGR